MSAFLKSMVLAKRQREADAKDRAAFLAAAKGDRGEPGPPGKDGKPGAAGRDGKPGKDGKNGKDGAIVLIRGGGGSGVDLASLLPGSESTEPSGIVVFQGGRAVNLPWSAFLALAGTNSTDYTTRVDFVGETVIYRGEAAPGSDEAAAVWRIRKITFAPDGDVSTVYANGSAEFAHVWADRATEIYS